ncbi:LysR family transcriptional regulator [Nostoc parmelioides]|uniref:LysR family transcriptional regulator n=1 Tax=Nostoc parmelioides FACHB-3921 TaxID=2692909 RepID=A0ABR8BDD1_9NOSO|nr:LysR family transcriptional regulator [Nostoc parmelioides]MBD2252107.1 LysR family transcriptional regulator [Nostoc parmelioides FACHB-3921]
MSNIHHINLAGIDLNLLVVFDALMTEQNVTRAALRLGLSQPATSNALARLRNLMEDELFVRKTTGLSPTPKAITLAQQLRPALQQIQSALLEPPYFEPATSDRVFAIGMSDYVEFILLPRLVETVQVIAPNISWQIRSGERQKLLTLLDKGEVDLVCGIFPEKNSLHQEQFLFDEVYCCLCRQAHPRIGSSLSIEDYLAESHLLVSIQEDRVGRVDTLLAQKNLQRHIAVSIPHFLIAPFILAQSNLLATLPQRVALTFTQSQSLKLLPVPLSMEGFSVFMRWHQSTDNIPADEWLRALITQVSNAI